MNNETNSEFEILGHKVKFRADEKSPLTAHEILTYVKKESQEIQKRIPTVDLGQLAILTALKIAQDKLVTEKELTTEVKSMHQFAVEALNLIEEVSPSPQ
jgi:cell division protein ZapA (FtsZ GTPase activity inhibitor)